MKSIITIKISGFTRVEACVLFFVLALFFLVILTVLSKAKAMAQSIECVHQLKQINHSYTLFANDHDNKYPMAIPDKEGGSLDYKENPLALYRHFMPLSNYLEGPGILTCPTDSGRVKPKNFGSSFEPASSLPPAVGKQTGNSNVGYFVGIDSEKKYPDMLLVGDRNIYSTNNYNPERPSIILSLEDDTKLKKPLLVQRFYFSEELHFSRGNVAKTDGSVWQLTSSSLQKAISDLNATNAPVPYRLAIPGKPGEK